MFVERTKRITGAFALALQLCFAFGFEAQSGGARGRILYTSSGGKRWTVRPTGINVRLNSIAFVDDTNGWTARCAEWAARFWEGEF